MDGRTDGQTDGRTNGWTDRPSYRDAWTHLKMGQKGFSFFFLVIWKKEFVQTKLERHRLSSDFRNFKIGIATNIVKCYLSIGKSILSTYHSTMFRATYKQVKLFSFLLFIVTMYFDRTYYCSQLSQLYKILLSHDICAHIVFLLSKSSCCFNNKYLFFQSRL